MANLHGLTAAVVGYVSVFLEAGCCCWAAAFVVGVSGERKTVEVGSEDEAVVCATVGVASLAAATAAALTSPLSSGGVISTSC